MLSGRCASCMIISKLYQRDSRRCRIMTIHRIEICQLLTSSILHYFSRSVIILATILTLVKTRHIISTMKTIYKYHVIAIVLFIILLNILRICQCKCI